MTTDFAPVHAALRSIMLEVTDGLDATSDAPGDLVVRTRTIDPKTKQSGWFGTVTIKKSYVAYHLMALYDDPSLADGLSTALSKRRQGKTCFNFKAVDEPTFEELRALTARARGL